jgi:hypothetical protein
VNKYDPSAALEDLKDEAVLPNPVHVRDMILRSAATPEQALELNRKFLAYQHAFSEAQKLATEVLSPLTQMSRES